MFGALISGHKFSDPEFCKNKIVSSCTLRSHALQLLFIFGHWKQKLEIKASALAGYMEGGTICSL